MSDTVFTRSDIGKNSAASNLNSDASNLNFMARSFCEMPSSFYGSNSASFHVRQKPHESAKQRALCSAHINGNPPAEIYKPQQTKNARRTAHFIRIAYLCNISPVLVMPTGLLDISANVL